MLSFFDGVLAGGVSPDGARTDDCCVPWPFPEVVLWERCRTDPCVCRVLVVGGTCVFFKLFLFTMFFVAAGKTMSNDVFVTGSGLGHCTVLNEVFVTSSWSGCWGATLSQFCMPCGWHRSGGTFKDGRAHAISKLSILMFLGSDLLNFELLIDALVTAGVSGLMNVTLS